MSDLSEQIEQLESAVDKLSREALEYINLHENGIRIAKKVREKIEPVGLSIDYSSGLRGDLHRLHERLEGIEKDSKSRIVTFNQPDHPFNSGVYVVVRVTSTRIFIRKPGDKFSDAYDRSGKPVECWEGSEGIDIRATFGIDADVLPGSFQL